MLINLNGVITHFFAGTIQIVCANNIPSIIDLIQVDLPDAFAPVINTLFSFLPPIIKNLLIINGLAFFAAIIFQRMGINLLGLLGLYIPQSDFCRGSYGVVSRGLAWWVAPLAAAGEKKTQ